MAWSLNSRCYPRQQEKAGQSTSWMVTQLGADVASRRTRSQWAAHFSMARLQSAGAGSGLDTLGAPLSVDTYSTAAAAAVRRIVSKYKIPRQVDSSALGTSLRRQTRGTQPGLERLDPTRSAALQRVSSRRQTTTSVGLGVCSNLCTHNKSSYFAWEGLFGSANFTSGNAIGLKSEAQKSNRIGNKQPGSKIVLMTYAL